MEHKNISFIVWDIGGQDEIRSLWRHYYQNTQGIIVVVDSNDREGIDNLSGTHNSAKEEFNLLLAEDALRVVSINIFANKQDLTNAPNEIENGIFR